MSPRLQSRGPIEARGIAWYGIAWYGSLRGYKAAAPLKHGRGWTRLYLVRKSPRLQSRGPIEATIQYPT